MKELFKQPVFSRLFAAGVTSQLGNTIGNMALAFYLLDRFSTQPFYATLAELMYSLPTLAVFFLVGVWADRLDRKRICAYSDWIRCGLTLCLLGATSAGWMPLVFGLLFTRSAVGKFFNPAQSALLQSSLKPEHYTQAAGMNQMVMGVFMLFGTGLGAMAYHTIGVQGAMILDACGFLISGLLIQATPATMEQRQPNGPASLRTIRLPMLVEDFRMGIRYITSNRLLLAIVSGFFILGFLNGAFAVLPMFTMKYKLAPEHFQAYSSFFSISLGVGLLPGSMLGAKLVARWGYIRIIVGGLAASALTGGIMAYSGNAPVFLVGAALLGFCIGPVNVAIGGWMPQIVDIGYRGRVNAWIDPVMMASQSIALGGIALFYPRFITLEEAYVFCGVCLLSAALLFVLKLPKLAAEQGGLRAGTENRGAVMEG